MKFVFNILKGIIIGSGAILPGISSGVMCVIFGIYENFLERILNFFKNPIDNIKFFLPYIIGGIMGVLLVGKLLLFLFNSYYTATCFAVIGLILGCIPSILKKCQTNISNKLLHWLLLLLTFSFSLYLVALESTSQHNNSNSYNSLSLIISGFFMSAGVVIPGVSSSAILMIMGIYENYLLAISNINLGFLFSLGIGLFLGGIAFLKIINFLFHHFRSFTYYAIAGFALGSILVIFPGFSLNIETLIGIILFILCFILSSSLDKLQ